MATINYKHGNTINLFYYDTDSTTWKTLAYGQSHSLSISNETQEVSSKDHGLHPDQLMAGSSWSISGEYLFTPENANIIQNMADSGKVYSFCLATVSEADHWADGIQPVTDINTNAKWTVGSAWVRYGNALVTSAEISAPQGEVATVSLELTGSGALLKTVMSSINGYDAD